MPEPNLHRELVAHNDTRHLAMIREAVREAAAFVPFPEKDVARIILAVDEAVANIMEHAYEDRPEGGDITITLDSDGASFRACIVDNGQEFDPSSISVPDIVEHVRKGKKKGLGIFLMRQIMDEVKYTFVQGLRNELRMVKWKNKNATATAVAGS